MDDPIGPDERLDKHLDKHLDVERAGTRLIITLDHAARKNALTTAMIAAITRHVDDAVLDDVTRVVVLRSTGLDFCTGIDLAESFGQFGLDTSAGVTHRDIQRQREETRAKLRGRDDVRERRG